jgi:DNA polymerase I-like protein with 3'-5' exonuclease and polymerase domains
MQQFYKNEIKSAFSKIRTDEVPDYESLMKNVSILSVDESIKVLKELNTKKCTIAFDYETTGGKPEADGHQIYSMSFSEKIGVAYSFLVCEKNASYVKNVLINPDIKKIAHNLKFEDRWTRTILGVPVVNWLADTMLMIHVINNQAQTGLKPNILKYFGCCGYETDMKKFLQAETDNGFNKIYNAPTEKLLKYGAIDSLFTRMLYPILNQQLDEMGLQEGAELLTKTARTFSLMESQGVLIDYPLLCKTRDELSAKIEIHEAQFKSTDLYAKWRSVYGIKTNIYSPTQLHHILYDVMKFTPINPDEDEWTTDRDTLEELDCVDLEPYIAAKLLLKVRDTYFASLEREMLESHRIHASMTLNVAKTYRTSCVAPNLQNVPVRNKEVKKYVRDLFIPNYGCMIVEADLKGAEVAGAACHTKDPNLIAYVSNSKLDMHRDIGEKLLKCDRSLISKDIRSILKGYTFGSFYGSYYALLAPMLWKALPNMPLTNGVLVSEWLASQGIITLAEYSDHVQTVDDYFWNEQYAVYGEWKKEQWQRFLKDGFVGSYTGFRFQGPMNKKTVTNYPIQCDSAHINFMICCYVAQALRKEGLRSRTFMQIHDSLLGNVYPDELTRYLEIHKEAVQAIRERWDWIIVPVEIEFEAAEIDRPWSEKKEIKL